MGNYHVNILPEISKKFVSYENFLKQDVGSESITYTQGYGQLSKAGATVQLGVTGHIEIDLIIKSLSKSFYEDTTNEIINTVSSSTAEELKEASSKNDCQSWWFAFLAGGSSGSHDSDYYRKQQNNTVTIADTKYFNAASSKMSSNEQNFRVSGTFDIVGQSYVPTTVYLFIETLNIQMADGTTIVIPTQNTAVADAQGQIGAGKMESKINIIPLG